MRLLFKKDQPDRKREVAVVIGLYAVLLIGASAVYGGGLKRTVGLVVPSAQRAQMEELAVRMVEEPNARRKYFIARELASFGEPAVEYFIPLLESDQLELRINARKEPFPGWWGRWATPWLTFVGGRCMLLAPSAPRTAWARCFLCWTIRSPMCSWRPCARWPS
jgi:hypothetical protein